MCVKNTDSQNKPQNILYKTRILDIHNTNYLIF